MLFDYLNVKAVAERSCRLTAKLCQKVYTDRHISREEYGDLFGCRSHKSKLLVGVSRCAYNERRVVGKRIVKQARKRGMMGKVNDNVSLARKLGYVLIDRKGGNGRSVDIHARNYLCVLSVGDKAADSLSHSTRASAKNYIRHILKFLFVLSEKPLLLHSGKKLCLVCVLHLAEGKSHLDIAEAKLRHRRLDGNGVDLAEQSVYELEILELKLSRA